jgi:hypothetical protein
VNVQVYSRYTLCKNFRFQLKTLPSIRAGVWYKRRLDVAPRGAAARRLLGQLGGHHLRESCRSRRGLSRRRLVHVRPTLLVAANVALEVARDHRVQAQVVAVRLVRVPRLVGQGVELMSRVQSCDLGVERLERLQRAEPVLLRGHHAVPRLPVIGLVLLPLLRVLLSFHLLDRLVQGLLELTQLVELAEEPVQLLLLVLEGLAARLLLVLGAKLRHMRLLLVHSVLILIELCPDIPVLQRLHDLLSVVRRDGLLEVVDDPHLLRVEVHVATEIGDDALGPVKGLHVSHKGVSRLLLLVVGPLRGRLFHHSGGLHRDLSESHRVKGGSVGHHVQDHSAERVAHVHRNTGDADDLLLHLACLRLRSEGYNKVVEFINLIEQNPFFCVFKL